MIGLHTQLRFAFLLLLPAISASDAPGILRHDSSGNVQPSLTGTWSARASSGLTLMGGWTATPDPASGAVTGTWTLFDAQGNTVADGAWSAAKAPTQWNGAWRAVVTGRSGEYSGTWTASVDLKADAALVDLFQAAAQTIVNGTWRAGAQSGAWAIRTSPKEGAPGNVPVALDKQRLVPQS